jgi:hypothetical protein
METRTFISSSSTIINAITEDSPDSTKAVRGNIVRGRKRLLPTSILALQPMTKQQQEQESPSSDSATSPFQCSSERLTSGSEVSFDQTIVTKKMKKKKPSTRERMLPSNYSHDDKAKKEKPSLPRSTYSFISELNHDGEDTNENPSSSPTPTQNTTPKFNSERKRKAKNAKDRLDRKRRKKPKQNKKYILDQQESVKAFNDSSSYDNSTNDSSTTSSGNNEGPKTNGSIPRFLPASIQRALKRLAPHNNAGHTTAGDNAFILDTALYSARETRRRRRIA